LHCAEHAFDLMHLDLWASPVVSVSGSKYYLVILDDFTHYLWIFPLMLKSDTFTTLSNFFAYVSNQFGRKIKAIQCDNGREFDNSSTRIFLLSNGTQLRMSCPYTPRRMVKPNVSFIPLTMSSALYLSKLPFPGVIGLKDYTQLHTS
jgi:hypothetical protein